jgi:hypothetical protein
MDILLSIARIEIDIALVIFTLLGLFEAFVVAKSKIASGETLFLAYRRAFITFGTAFISGIVTGLMAEPPDGIATEIGFLNALYLFVFWLQAWVKSSSEKLIRILSN